MFMGFKFNWDAFGITTSIACAIHCALLPLIFSSLPLFGVNIIENLTFELCMILLAAAVGMYSLFHGYKKHHHSVLPIVIFAIGIVFLILKQIWHQQEIFFLIPGLINIVTAHIINYKLCRKHNHAHSDDCEH